MWDIANVSIAVGFVIFCLGLIPALRRYENQLGDELRGIDHTRKK